MCCDLSTGAWQILIPTDHRPWTESGQRIAGSSLRLNNGTASRQNGSLVFATPEIYLQESQLSLENSKHNMSTAGEEHGNKRGSTEGRATGQQRQNAPPRDSSAQNRRGGKGGGGTATQNLNGKTPESPSAPNPPPQDEHVPLTGFNSVEVDELLRKGFDTKAPVYRPDLQPQKSGGVWGAKAGAMVNGKDFWLELRKQVTALQRSGGVSQGG